MERDPTSAPWRCSPARLKAHLWTLTVAWEGFPHLGLWMRPGGDFLCIEPWAGMASPPDFDGDILEKPWMILIPPGESRRAGYTVTVEPG